jgi:predicted glycosyltransferase involved in capsule biosynthesis
MSEFRRYMIQIVPSEMKWGKRRQQHMYHAADKKHKSGQNQERKEGSPSTKRTRNSRSAAQLSVNSSAYFI